MSERPIPFVVRPGDAATIQGPAGGPLSFMVRGAESGGSLAALVNVIAPLDGPPAHVHANEDESWYIIEGELRFKLDGVISHAPAGAFVFVPRGVAHCFQNVADGPARILVVFTPSGMEHFFDRFAALGTGPVDPSAFATLGREVGMTVVGPPLAISDPLSW